MGKMWLTSCRALSTSGKFSNVDRYANSKNALLLKHPDNDYHQEANQLCQRKQADHYNYKAGSDKRILQNMEPVYMSGIQLSTYGHQL